MAKKKSLFSRLAGSMKLDDEAFDDDVFEGEEQVPIQVRNGAPQSIPSKAELWMKEEDTMVGHLTVDVYQTPAEVIIQTMIAGTKPEDIHVAVTRDMVTIKGKREDGRSVNDEHFYAKELYWGAFSRTISLPHEVDPDGAEAIESHGMLTLKLPKLDRTRETKLKIKSL
jgi:HSP20 family protein